MATDARSGAYVRAGGATPARPRRRLAAVVIALAAVALVTAGLAIGDDSSPTAAALGQAGVLQASANVVPGSDADSAMVANTANASVDVPTDPSAGVTVDPANGPPVTIGIPGADQATDAQPVANGIVSYSDTAPGVDTAVQVLPAVDAVPPSDPGADDASVTVQQDQGTDTASTDSTLPSDVTVTDSTTTTDSLAGGVRVLTVIKSPDSPTDYSFPLIVPDGGQLTATPDGGYTVVDSTGATTLVIPPPWATDANGSPVPASYSLDGATLTLHVDHAGAAYPVVADPTAAAVRCTTVAKQRNYTDKLGIVLMKFAMQKYWCWDGKHVTSAPPVTTAAAVTTAGGILGWQYERLIGANDYYISWGGQANGGHYSIRQGNFKRCLVWLCIGQWTPLIWIEAHANGTSSDGQSG